MLQNGGYEEMDYYRTDDAVCHCAGRAGPAATKSCKKEGTASFYAQKFNGRKTFSGEVFDNSAMTAAHNTLPMGTFIKVTNLRNNKWVVVKVTDRLHAANTRVVDLTQAAAKKLGFYNRGLTKVRVDVVPKSFFYSVMQSFLG
ncbi:septal ring lytic transglycosylase RlpA family protein [Chitinophaga sedimenti]|uniref:septal ring lytic transglycosylase RlpA family protein n=1 Tax=Chitinophaga sedimenti TaxID=2033606 RepID=UPI0020055234|nr:septal ring lytic transglycosylase RlpA family protein [Chitinophaga sedimenti]MCK7556884.1 septal ring lytic transglycosylase RlpA family protein [Chitinophaga sedimenti]